MLNQPFVSHGQNREDVVLWRALSTIRSGRYVEIGANDPYHLSITKAFYDRGWSGITVEPDPEFAEQQRRARPRDIMVEAAIADREGPVRLHLFPGTGISTLRDDVKAGHTEAGYEGHPVDVQARRLTDVLREHGFDKLEVHFMVVDVEGAEAEVLKTVDLRAWRPWILVIEATLPNSATETHHEWEPTVLEAGYSFCQFDGVSRFYVAAEHAPTLGHLLAYPACALDEFVTYEYQLLNGKINDAEARASEAQTQVEMTTSRLTTEILRWRTAALTTWAEGASVAAIEGNDRDARDGVEAAKRELEAMRNTVSWRLTRPLRAVRRAQRRPRG